MSATTMTVLPGFGIVRPGSRPRPADETRQHKQRPGAPSGPGRTPEGQGGGLPVQARIGDFELTYRDHGPVVRAVAPGQDRLRMLVVQRGNVTITRDDRTWELERRHALLVRGGTTATYATRTPAAIVEVDMPAHVAPITLRAPVMTAGPAEVVPAAAGAYLLDVLRGDVTQLRISTRVQLAETAHPMLANAIAAIAASSAEQMATEQDARRREVLAYIARKYTDPDLSSVSISEAMNIGRRSLQRLFEGQPRNVKQLIDDTRAAHALARLSNPDLLGVPLSEIAILCGYATVQVMRRGLKTAAGHSPTEVRERTRARHARHRPEGADEG